MSYGRYHEQMAKLMSSYLGEILQLPDLDLEELLEYARVNRVGNVMRR